MFNQILIALSLTIPSPASSCHPGLSALRELQGSFDMHLKTSSHTFLDKLEITKAPTCPEFNRPNLIEGVFTVPGVFTSPLENGEATVTFRWSTNFPIDLHFSIIARERGREYPVYFRIRGMTDNICDLRGDAYLDAAGTQYMASVRLEKTSGDCRKEIL